MKASFPARLLGIGVVMPGPFDIEGMSSVGPTTLPGWSGIDAAAVLSKACGEPVLVENDANAAAVGERLFGAGHAISNFAMIYFGAGIGLGMIRDGAPFRGAFGNAGEIGHIVITPGGRACACGQKGCLETYASLHTLREKLHAAGIKNTDFDALEKLHLARNPVLMGWLQEAADHLAPMIAMIENILDPETIILGGMLPDAIIDDLIWHMGIADFGRKPPRPRIAARHPGPDRAVYRRARRRRAAHVRGHDAKTRHQFRNPAMLTARQRIERQKSSPPLSACIARLEGCVPR